MQNWAAPDMILPEMPHDLAAECSVLGAILINPEVYEYVEALVPNAFYRAEHQLIFNRMLELAEEGQPIDLVTLASRLQDHKELEDIGGVSYLSKLAHSVPTTANIESYVASVHNKFMTREFIRSSMAGIQAAMAGEDIQRLVTSAQQVATTLADQAAPKQDFKRISNVLVDVIESTENKAEVYKTGKVTGIETGYTDLDAILGGLQNSDLIIVAARPSVGKTAFALNIAQNVATRVQEPVAIFSLEMSAEQLVTRMVSAEGILEASKLRIGDMGAEDWTKMANAAGVLGGTNIVIDDSPGITVHDIRSKCRRLKKQEGLGLIVIDYLQLIASVSKGRGAENRQQEVSEISRTLKHLAREMDVPIIALSQLSRGVEQRQDKRPMMSDLRESGSIEQDADIVAFLYRDDYYDKESEKKNIIEIIIAKQRNGPVGTVELVFLKQFNKFVNYDRVHMDPGPQPPRQHKVVNMEKRQYA
ncbi:MULTISPECIES: replicative DNA helicase [Paenibacillus]|jgi:replicative DNA helicase|uniref:replicative DNA helicase n=1 Tax=Paenibacillus TaxID=44249 RepID=UPI00240E16E3|nr:MULTISPECIES: replicative DNA helicase [Paenibacillus]MCI1777689.1 replicative DNA helicase [Paenibacillus lautus]WFB57628.1 replicative DNA helicase [Paenibacillus sp. BR1-192]